MQQTAFCHACYYEAGIVASPSSLAKVNRADCYGGVQGS